MCGGRARSAAAAATRTTSAEADEEQELGERAVRAGEEDRDDHDRPELAGDARSEHRRAEPRRQQARVGEHRDERSERGRAERDAEQPALRIETADVQQEADDDGDRERDRPADRAPDERPGSDVVLHELHAGEEEQEDEAQVGQEVDVVVDLREVEPFRADQDPEQDLEHDRGQDEAPVEPGQDRPGAGRGEHQDEGADVRRRLDGERDERRHEPVAGVSPQLPAKESPGSSRISASPVRNAFGGQVIGSTARLRRFTSGSGSPVKTIRYR